MLNRFSGSPELQIQNNMEISCIYKITNKVNQKIYIGSSVDFYKRKSGHLYNFRKQTHQDYFQKAYNKYGEENFVFEILEIVEDKAKLLKREQFYLDVLKPWIRSIGYNIAKIAGSQLGFKHSQETKDKLSEIQIGKSYTDKVGEEKAKEWINKIIIKNKGKKRSQEFVEKCTGENNGFFNKLHSIESRKIMSDKRIGKEPYNKGKLILQFDLNNNLIQEIELHDIQIKLGIPKSNVVKCCQGERNKAGGFIWSYK